MKNLLTCTLLVLVVSSCSYFDQETSTKPSELTKRSVASVRSQSCGDIMSFLMNRRNFFTTGQFENEFISLGFGHLYHSMKVMARQREGSEIHQSLLNKMRNHLVDGADSKIFLSELSEQERKLLWRDVIRPQAYEIEEQALSMRAMEGDDIAAFLLEVPRGSQRENAESAVILMKQLNPDIDESTVVARLQRELGACLN